jgi:carboxyl-terminal processing protease
MQTAVKWVLVVTGVLVLCGAVAVAGYYVGQRSVDSPEREVLAETGTADQMEPTLPAPSATTTATPGAMAAQEQPTSMPPATPTALAPVVIPSPTPPPLEPVEGPPLERTTEFTPEDLDTLWEVWDIVREEYDGELPSAETLSSAAIEGLLRAVDDPYTNYTPPEEAETIRSRAEGSYEGIGAYVLENDEGLTEILQPIEGAPAEAAGLRPGDVVLAVDGDPVVEKTLEEVISLIKGPEGTEVTLTIGREGSDPFDVTITRAKVDLPVLEAEMLPDEIAYLRLMTFFNFDVAEQVDLALTELLAQNPRGLILDLRGNPGGFLLETVQIADMFLADGVILYERSRSQEIQQVYRAEPGGIAENVPLVVLIDGQSASASEIVAGAIQDLERGILVGTTTFGKGSVQQSHSLSDGSELRVTVARWYTPNNNSIDGSGVVPDIEVTLDEEAAAAGQDPQLERAVEYLLNGE